MVDLQKEFHEFYNKHVCLSEKQRKELAEYREINIKRLKSGLSILGYPLPEIVVNHGSYSTHTTTQHPDKDYDIDIAIIFEEEDLPASAFEARKRIERAVTKAGENFSKPPEARTNAVTIWYQEGYHVDLAVHRTRDILWGETICEHAGTEWKKRDPLELTNWFNQQVRDKSPTEEMGASIPEGQMRRIVQLVKFFCKSRRSWSLPGGLIICVLVDKCYRSDLTSDERSLHNTLISMKEHLDKNTEIMNPVNVDQALTYKDEYRNQVIRLRDQLDLALVWLELLNDPSCDKEKAAKSWRTFFNHEYWTELIEEIEQSKLLGQSLRDGTFVTSHGHVTSSKPEGESIRTEPHKYYGD